MDIVNQLTEIIERKGGKQFENNLIFNILIVPNISLNFLLKDGIIHISLFNSRMITLLKCKYENAITDILLTDLIDMWVSNYQLFL